MIIALLKLIHLNQMRVTFVLVKFKHSVRPIQCWSVCVCKWNPSKMTSSEPSWTHCSMFSSSHVQFHSLRDRFEHTVFWIISRISMYADVLAWMDPDRFDLLKTYQPMRSIIKFIIVKCASLNKQYNEIFNISVVSIVFIWMAGAGRQAGNGTGGNTISDVDVWFGLSVKKIGKL